MFNGGFGLVNRWGIRKPVFNAFKLLNEAGDRRWNVSGIELAIGGAGVVAHASKAADGSAHVILTNHESAALNVTIQVRPAAAMGGATVARVDDTHANAYTAWLAMGSPSADSTGLLSACLAATAPLPHSRNSRVSTHAVLRLCRPGGGGRAAQSRRADRGADPDTALGQWGWRGSRGGGDAGVAAAWNRQGQARARVTPPDERTATVYYTGSPGCSTIVT